MSPNAHSLTCHYFKHETDDDLWRVVLRHKFHNMGICVEITCTWRNTISVPILMNTFWFWR